MIAPPLTSTETRVLNYCAAQGDWVPLLSLARVKTLEWDDLRWIPRLIAAGYLDHNADIRAVRLSGMGREIAMPCLPSQLAPCHGAPG